MAPLELPRVLFVDDEPQGLQGLSLNLRRSFNVTTALSGEAALVLLRGGQSFEIIVSDMRMPGMSGAAFLAQARLLAPTTVRFLLTGESDLMSAVKAINDGQIFRFITKPCPTDSMVRFLSEGVAQFRLLTVEKELLEKTLHGSIKALTEVLSMVNPEAFGRAARMKRLASLLAEALKLPEKWTVEVAAMLSQLGFVTIPPAVVEKVYHGRALAPAEKDMVDRVPVLTRQIMGNIPRIEKVLAILDESARPEVPTSAGARILRMAAAYDQLEGLGFTHLEIVDRLAGRKEELDINLLELLAEAAQLTVTKKEFTKVRVIELRAGMILAADLQATNGTLLLPRGHEISASSLARIKNFARSTALKEPIEILS